MKDNKGFTLAEVIMTLALISIVMVGVVAMMRSSSIFYLNGYKEVNLQEEAQIASAQIENMLVDAKANIVNEGTAGYKIYLADGSSVHLLLDNTKKKLMCKNDSTDEYEPLADYVDSFSISGIYNTSMPKDQADNCVTLSLKMGYPEDSGLTDVYTLDKDIFFRNMVEDSTRFDIQYNETFSSSGGDDEPDYDYICEVKRYEPANLEKLFQVHDIHLSSGTDSYYTVSGNTVSLNSTATGNFTTAYGMSTDLLATATGADGTQKKIKLYTEKVKICDYSDIFVYHNTVTQNAGFQTYIEVEGINIYNASKVNLAGNDKIVKYDMKLYVKGEYGSNPCSNTPIKTPPEGQKQAGNANHQMNFSFGRLNMELVADPNSSGMILTTNNDSLTAVLSDYDGVLNNNKNGNDRVELTIHLQNESKVPQLDDSRNIKYYIIGRDLTKFQ